MWVFFRNDDQTYLIHSGLTRPGGVGIGHPEYEDARQTAVRNYNNHNGTELMVDDVFGIPVLTDPLATQVFKANNPAQVLHQDGEVVVVVVDPSTVPTIFCHIAVSGGDGLDPVGILNDGVSSANVTITLREGEDPGSALFNVEGSLINQTWRVPVIKGERTIWTTVEFVDSVASGVYRTSGEPGLLRLAPELLDPVTLGGTTYQFSAVGDTEIIVSEELATA